jgi:DNA-binding beta-propeller fold protein YncE
MPSMRVLVLGSCLLAVTAAAQESAGPYKVVKRVKAGGEGGFDYVYADVAGRKLYIPRTGPTARIMIFNLDTLEPAGQIAETSARGVAVDPKSKHGFASSKPVAMWDTETLKPIKKIDVQGNPDGILFDAYNDRVYVFSHTPPNATVIDSKDGSVVGTIDLGGAPEQAASDGAGRLYVDLEDKDAIAVVDTKSLQVTKRYDLAGKGGGCAGLAFDVKNKILFAACRNPQNLVVLSAETGSIITTLPIGRGVDGAVFNPDTHEVFSSQGDGTLTVVKANSPTSFTVEQTVKTMPSAKTLTLDTKTNRIMVIGAEFGPPPATPPPGGRAGRGALVPDSFSILVIEK